MREGSGWGCGGGGWVGVCVCVWEGGSKNKLLPIQYSWTKSWLPFTLIFFHYV